MHRSWFALATLAALCPALVGCGAVTVPSLERASDRREWTAPEGSARSGVVRVEVRVDSGVVRVRPGAELSASVDIEVPLAEADRLGEFELLSTEGPDGIARLTVVGPDGSIPAVSMDLRVPPWIEVSIRSNRADVLALGVGVPLTVESDSGRIDASFRGGSADLRTNSGRIRVDGSFADAELRSVSGDIEVLLPPTGSALARLHVENDRGDVRLHGHEGSFRSLRFGTDSGALRPMVPGDWMAADGTDVQGSKVFYAAGANARDHASLVVESRTGDLDLVFDIDSSAVRSELSDLARVR